MVLFNIYLNYDKSKINMDILYYINKNLEKSVYKAKIIYRINLIKPTEITGLKNKGITKLPALEYNDKKIYGTTNIIDNIEKFIINAKHQIKLKSDEENLLDHQTAVMMQGISKNHDGEFIRPKEEDDDEDDMSKDNIMKKMNDAIKRREDGKSKKNNKPISHIQNTQHAEINQPNNQMENQFNNQFNNQLNNQLNNKFNNKFKPDVIITPDDKNNDDKLLENLLSKLGGDDDY
jgi:hypothetical protein